MRPAILIWSPSSFLLPFFSYFLFCLLPPSLPLSPPLSPSLPPTLSLHSVSGQTTQLKTPREGLKSRHYWNRYITWINMKGMIVFQMICEFDMYMHTCTWLSELCAFLSTCQASNFLFSQHSQTNTWMYTYMYMCSLLSLSLSLSLCLSKGILSKVPGSPPVLTEGPQHSTGNCKVFSDVSTCTYTNECSCVTCICYVYYNYSR